MFFSGIEKRSNFGSKEKEVCNKETVTYLLTNFISFYKEA